MIPVKADEKDFNYPNFQTDQILTASHLNHMFNFLDVQERLTRTNLVGIGIVCGLKVSRSGDGKTVTITKGTGVTSHGYLIAHGIENSDDPVIYRKYRNFDALKVRTYDVFVNGNIQKYALWELIDKAHEATGDRNLSNEFLKDKVCLLFYEILDEQAKNCDPLSCDDKGVKVFINIRPLLISVTDATTIINTLNAKSGASGSGEVFPGIFNLPDIKLPGFDVPATSLETTSDVYNAYRKIFTKKFVEGTGEALNKAFNTFKGYLKGEDNPFANFNLKFGFLHDGSIDGNSLLNFQYYYDFFCDLLTAYNEWRESALQLTGLCTPPEALFPRHLFLGTPDSADEVSKSFFRNYFIPSPIHTVCSDKYNDFRGLFSRLERLISNLKIPVPSVSGTASADANIRVTPSMVGSQPLGKRAIPFYYTPDNAGRSLLKVWDPELTSKGKEQQILSYNPSYNTQDDFVRNPLLYDLEPYNFFRIEGHIGKKYYSALASIQTTVKRFRLPFNVVAVSVDSLPGSVDQTLYSCHFNDLEAVYDELKAALLCRLCRILACIYKLPKQSGEIPEEDELIKSNLELIQGCKDVLFYSTETIGYAYEQLHPTLIMSKDSGFEIIEALDKENLFKMMEDKKAAAVMSANMGFVTDATLIVFFTKLIILLIKLSESLTEQLSSFDYNLMNSNVKKINTSLQLVQGSDYPILKEIFSSNQCLGDLLNLCGVASFHSVFAEYVRRTGELKKMQSLKQFSASHPGLRHKGGVPEGGTFVMVYRNIEVSAAAPVFEKDLLLGEFIVSEAAGDEVNAKAKEKIIGSVAKTKYTAKRLALLKTQSSLMKDKGMSDQEIEEILGISLSDLQMAAGAADDKVSWIGNGTVIADFYLPYQSNSDCPPVQYVVNIPPPKISFSLEKAEYCNADTSEYIFTTNPIAGEIITSQPDTVLDMGNGLYSFIPSKVIIPEGQNNIVLSFTYTKDDQSQTINITVYRMPEVKIKAVANPVNPLEYNFAPEPADSVTSAVWSFGDGSTGTQISPTHVYSTAGDYKISLEVKNVECTAIAEDINISVSEPEPVKVTIEQNEVCVDVKSVPFTITPAGGTLTGESFTEKPAGSGKYTFIPSAVNLNGASKKQITFNYTSLQGATATFNITVFDKPYGKRSLEAGTLILYLSFSDLSNTSVINADFGDGIKESYDVTGPNMTKIHRYAKGGNYVIKTALVNGPCILKIEDIEVAIKDDQPAVKVCQSFSVPVESYFKLRDSLFSSEDFRKSYSQEIDNVEEFFKALSDELARSGKVDLSFFDKYQLKADWIRLLPVKPAASRTLSLQLLMIFISIITIIACMQKEDISGTVMELFKFINAKLNEIGKLNAAEKGMVQKFIDYLKDEIDKLNSFGEAGIKHNYLNALNGLIDILNQMLI
jgi:PKD repeat protein